jgi:hypothetical protein
MDKRTIRAKDIVQDIRANMTDAQLMQKYQLSAKGLHSILKKLIEHNLLAESDLELRPVGYDDTVTMDFEFFDKRR